MLYNMDNVNLIWIQLFKFTLMLCADRSDVIGRKIHYVTSMTLLFVVFNINYKLTIYN